MRKHWIDNLRWVTVLLVQVVSEERRLHRDFGDEYNAYRRRTRRF